MRRLVLVAVAGCLGIALITPVGGGAPAESLDRQAAKPMDLSSFGADKPSRPLRLLFIHHSCGGQLFAPLGDDRETASCIYVSSPNGGNLRQLLHDQGYETHEASYGSEIGEATDLFDWLPKMQHRMEQVLTVDENDRFFTDGRKNQIVVFKSCYPNSDFTGEGTPPGNAAGPELTVWNAKATLSALLPEFAKHPDVLYVYMTAPPRAPKVAPERLYRMVWRKLRGEASAQERHSRSAALARGFNRWVAAQDGWLRDYAPKNVVVFDYYDVLTDHGASNLSRFASNDGWDSHPVSAGNAKAAAEFVPFLNRAVPRAGLAP
jgi:hypothetical protein